MLQAVNHYYVFDHYSDSCLKGDGTECMGDACWCPCHGDHAPWFRTVDEVAEYHLDHSLTSVDEGHDPAHALSH